MDAEPQRTRAATASTTTPPRSITKGTQQPVSPRSPPPSPLHIATLASNGGSGGASSPRGTRRARANTLTPMRTPPPMSPLPHDAIYDSIHLYTVRSQRGGLRERSRLNKTISKLARNELTRHVDLLSLCKRTSVSLKAAIRPNREGHIFDYFCVVGYPPAAKVEIKASAQARRQEPVILYQYPEDNQLNEQVVHFCFPNGVTPTVSLRKKTADQKTATLELANCTMKELKDSERSFLFLMTGNGALLYGICVSQNELLSCLEKPSFFKQPAYNPPSPLSPTELRYEVSAPRVYCLLSRFPFFKLHFNVLYTLLETERTMQREARERARMQSGMASKTEQASTAAATRANSISSEVEATKDLDREREKDKEDEREKKGGAWNWRWRWGKDKDKKDSKDGSNKDTSKDPAPKMARTSSANSLSNWTVKKTIKDDISATRAESSTSITTALISPRRGRANSRGAPEKPDTTLSSTKDEGEITPRGRSATTKNESEDTSPARKRSNSRVRSLFALGANKIERGEIVSTIGDESGNAQPQAAEAEEASPFPGIRLHQNHEAEEATGPFPGIRLRMCKEAASEDQATHSNAVAGAADAELGDAVTTPAAGARRRADTTDDQPDSSKEKNKVVALLEAYYNTNIRSTLGSFTVKLPSAKRHGKFVCPEGDEEKLIMEWCAPTMLRLLPLPNIIMLMRALLQEYKIVLLCKNLGVLSFIAMALLPLLRPFEWQGPFIPLVPKNLEECVESPVPCVLGMPTTCEEDLIPVVMDDCLIVNIETEQVVLPERPLAPLPNEEDFYAQLGVYHSKIYRPVNSPDRDTAFHRPAKSTDEEQAVAAGFLSLVRSYQERLVQEIVNYAHIHCISESSPAPSLPSLPLSASPSLSAPCMPSVTSPSVTSAAFAGSVTTSFSPLASSASYSSLTTFEQAELEETLSHAYTDRHHYAGAAAAMNYVRPPPLSPGGASPQRRHFQLPPAVHSYSLALPTIRELDSDDDSGGGGAKSDDEGRLESTPFNLASSPSGGGGAKKDPTKRRLLMDDHEQWARTRSDNSDEVVSAKVALGCSDVVDLSSSAGGKGHKTKQGGKTKGKSGRRKGHGEGGFAATSALIQTLPHNRELEDIKAQVEIDRVSSDDIKGAQEMKAKTKSEKNESDSESDEEGESSSTTASLRTHPMRTSKNLSFSASSIPAFVESTSPDPNPPAPINLAQFIDGQTGGTKNESEGSGRRKVVAIPTLPIRMRGATPLSTSDQPMQPGSSSPTHSPPSSPKFGGSSASGADHSDTNADGAPQLILSLRPSVPPLSSHLPQLAASSFDWTDMNSLKKLVCLFPVTQQKFIANFLFTQHFTMFTERLAKIFGEKRSRKSNVITPRSAARFLDQLKKMIDQEEGQATMARSLLQIYTMLEEQKEVVGGGASDETTGDHQHHQVHAVGSPPVDHHSLAVPHSQPSQQPNRKSVLGISLASSSDFGMGKVKDAIKHSGSSIGVRGEVTAPPSGHSGHSSSSLSVSPAASAASPVGAVKRPGHRRQGSVGGQEILKIKPEEEIEGEVGKEQKNMEQIIKLSDERLRILTRSKDTLKALFNSDSPTSSQQSSPLTFVASGGGEVTSSSPSSLSSTTVSPSAVTIPSPRSANGASLIPAKPATSSSPPSPSSSLATSTSTTSRPSTKALLSPRRQQGGPQINIVVTGDSDRDSVESEDSLQEAEDRRKGNKKIRGRAGARRASLGGGDDPQQQLSPRSRGPEVETDAQRRLRSPSDSP